MYAYPLTSTSTNCYWIYYTFTHHFGQYIFMFFSVFRQCVDVSGGMNASGMCSIWQFPGTPITVMMSNCQ